MFSCSSLRFVSAVPVVPAASLHGFSLWDVRDRSMQLPTQRHRSRLVIFIFTCLLCVFMATVVVPTWQKAWAADDASKTDEAKTDTSTVSGSNNIVLHIIKSVKWMWPIIAILSISLVALIVLLAMDLRMGEAVPPVFVEEFTDTVNKRKFKEAFDLARQDNSYLARVLTVGMGRLQYGIEDAREVAMNTVESIKATKEQLITYLATIGTLGPLLGLVGTVYSMIGAFMKMSDRAHPVDSHDMADTLSHGLVVTMLGIGLAVPAIFCHAFFRNRLTRISMDTANVADDLLTQMYHNSKKAGGAATTDVASAAKRPAAPVDARLAPIPTVKPAD
jgi:biopolymer transport protein ExbB